VAAAEAMGAVRVEERRTTHLANSRGPQRKWPPDTGATQDAGIYAATAILSALAPDVGVLLFARTLIGLAIGADSAIATAYIAEYAPKNRRGSLALLQQWMITVGILVAYIVALIIFVAFPGSAASVGWRLVLGLGAVPALVGLALRTQMPESPRWPLRYGKYDQVRKGHGRPRGRGRHR
jgi:MFS family permease